VIGRVVAFEVEDVDGDRPWSVLVRGLVLHEEAPPGEARQPLPRVATPGGKLIRIRSDAVTGRRLGPPPG
jgi:hypothetical protein